MASTQTPDSTGTRSKAEWRARLQRIWEAHQETLNELSGEPPASKNSLPRFPSFPEPEPIQAQRDVYRKTIAPLLPDLEAIVTALNNHNVKFVVIGSAIEMVETRYGHHSLGWGRAPVDVDLWVKPSRRNLAKLAKALEDLEAEKVSGDLENVRYGDNHRAEFRTKHGFVDIEGRPSGFPRLWKFAATEPGVVGESAECRVVKDSKVYSYKARYARQRARELAAEIKAEAVQEFGLVDPAVEATTSTWKDRTSVVDLATRRSRSAPQGLEPPGPERDITS